MYQVQLAFTAFLIQYKDFPGIKHIIIIFIIHSDRLGPRSEAKNTATLSFVIAVCCIRMTSRAWMMAVVLKQNSFLFGFFFSPVFFFLNTGLSVLSSSWRIFAAVAP